MYNVCSPIKRVVAAIIDYLSIGVLGSIVIGIIDPNYYKNIYDSIDQINSGNQNYDPSLYSNSGSATQIFIQIAIAFLILCVIPYFWKSQTLGRLITKTRVVTEEFQKPTFGVHVMRDLLGYIVTIILISCCCAGLIVNAILCFGQKNTSLSDLIAKTKLIDIDSYQELEEVQSFEDNAKIIDL